MTTLEIFRKLTGHKSYTTIKEVPNESSFKPKTFEELKKDDKLFVYMSCENNVLECKFDEILYEDRATFLYIIDDNIDFSVEISNADTERSFIVKNIFYEHSFIIVATDMSLLKEKIIESMNKLSKKVCEMNTVINDRLYGF